MCAISGDCLKLCSNIGTIVQYALRTVVSYYLNYINTFVLSGYPDRFLHHLFRKSKGRVYAEGVRVKPTIYKNKCEM